MKALLKAFDPAVKKCKHLHNASKEPENITSRNDVRLCCCMSRSRFNYRSVRIPVQLRNIPVHIHIARAIACLSYFSLNLEHQSAECID